MSSNRPYMLRAFYEWIVDNNCTPHLVVDANFPGTEVPQQYVQNGQIVLNVSPTATGNLQMSNELITFNARFGGQPMQLRIPYGGLLGIYARENGAGTIFHGDENADSGESEMPANKPNKAKKDQLETNKADGKNNQPEKRGSHLKVIK